MENPENRFKPEANIYCDGASSGNPGHSGIGVVIQVIRGSHKIYKISEYIGVATNNVAEYSALIRGLQEAQSSGLKKIEIFLDSELLVKQITGAYKVRSPLLMPLWKKSKEILKLFETYRINHMQRAFNREADMLAKNAIKTYKKRHA
jgi:ribonuclease HI